MAENPRGTGAPVQREVVVPNREGLHFRPIMQLVDAAAPFTASVTIYCGDRAADGRSPMELLMLVATQGATLRIVADGGDAEAAADAVAQLIESGFGEE